MANLLYLMGFLTPPPLGRVSELALESSPHVTLLSNFTLPTARLGEFSRTVRALTPWWGPVLLDPLEPAVLGTPDNPVPTTLLSLGDVPESLYSLHTSLLEALHNLDGDLDQPQFAGANFKPHISHWTPQAGRTYTLPGLTLVHHTGGSFGVGVENLAYYPLRDISP